MSATQHSVFSTTGMYGTTNYAVMQHRPGCFSVGFIVYVPHVPMTAAEVEAQEAEYAAEAAYMTAHGYSEPQPDCYTTAEAAQRATELHDAMSNADDDVRAFGAPSECLSLACKPLIRELEALEEKYGTRLNPPTLGEQYAERGLEDRTRPIAESLPAGMHDDRDILAHLGERSAL